jgi:lipoate-protein ligase A
MLILDSPSNDPAFNIAAEEYLLKEKTEEYAFFYINDPSVIIGKHQNALAEINLPWTRQHDIPVIRRLSGGGTVWHDRGNLNFSFIRNGEQGKLVNFREYAAPVLACLKGMGLEAEFGDRNEMLAGGIKISGNAEHIHRNRVLHHGTLLYSSDLTRLKNALDMDPDLYEDKAVQSIRSRVGNICDLLEKPMDIADFRRQVIARVIMESPGSEIYALTDLETERIQELVTGKYDSWEWNMGYSPRYRLRHEWMIGRVLMETELEVEKGHIKTCRLTVLKQFLTSGVTIPGEEGKSMLPDDSIVTGAKDYGDLDDILGEARPAPVHSGSDTPGGSNPPGGSDSHEGSGATHPGQGTDPAVRDARRLEYLAGALTGQRHDPAVLREMISEGELVKPGWIDTFVKGLFPQSRES